MRAVAKLSHAEIFSIVDIKTYKIGDPIGAKVLVSAKYRSFQKGEIQPLDSGAAVPIPESPVADVPL